MNDPTETHKQASFLQSVFTPLTILWLSAVAFGVILPVVLQGTVASWVSDLSSASYLENGVPVTPTLNDFYISVAFLTMILIGYIIVFCHQAFYVFKNKNYSSLWSLILILTGPIFIWLVLPALLY